MGYVNKTYLSTQFKNFADKIAKVFSKIGHTHLKSDITDFPTSMPANGGNAATVGGHTVGVNVPSNAKFTDTTYGVATSSALGLVKSGTDITVDSSGNVSVNDDSHNHVISNVDGLQTALDGKAASSHTHTKSQITDFPTSLPASDVYAWAKASTKPTYTANEVGALKAYNLQYKLPANNGGWHKIAKITNTPTPYWSFDLYATGNWNYVSKSNAHFHILNRNGTVIIEQISGIVGYGIATIRMVRESEIKDVWILEEFSSNSPGEEFYSFIICGDVGLTPLDGELDTNDASVYKATVTLPVVNIPTGNNITSGNIQEQSVKHANSSDKVSHALAISYEKDGVVSYQSFDGSADTELNISVITDIAGPSKKGLMSAEDKFKLDGIQAGATKSNKPLTINLRQKKSTLSMEYTGEFEKSITIHDWETGTIVDLIYPVGSIYMSVNNVNPSTFLGGTWEAWGSGQVPVGVNPNDSDFSTAEKTGGSKSVTPSGTVGGHTLTTNEMPSHGHSISIPASGACTTDSQGNHQHKTNATFVDNAVRLSSEHNTVMGWVSGWGYKSNANKGINAKTDVSLSIYVPQLSMSTNGLHAHNVPNHTHSVTQYNAGGNGSHDHSFTGNVQSNIQPYITCYMWKRTA